MFKNRKNRRSPRRPRKRGQRRGWRIFLFVLFVLAAVLIIYKVYDNMRWQNALDTEYASEDGRPPIDVQLLTPNRYSRPQISMKKIDGIVIHYTANPGTTAQENRDYFEGLKDGEEGTHASSHFIIGMDGEIIQCIPSSEISYASNGRNSDTLSIECCHPDKTGKFTDATYRSLVVLTAWLCRHFDISVDNVIRHYDVTGKVCPKYFVDHEDAWKQFLEDVRNQISEQTSS